MNQSKPAVVSLGQLAEAVKAGVVLALEERTAAAVDGGSLASFLEPSISVTVGMFPPREPDYFLS